MGWTLWLCGVLPVLDKHHALQHPCPCQMQAMKPNHLSQTSTKPHQCNQKGKCWAMLSTDMCGINKPIKSSQRSCKTHIARSDTQPIYCNSSPWAEVWLPNTVVSPHAKLHAQSSLADRKVINTCIKTSEDREMGFLFEPGPPALVPGIAGHRAPRPFRGMTARCQRHHTESYLHPWAHSCSLLGLPGGAWRWPVLWMRWASSPVQV